MQSRKSLVLGALLAGGITATIAARHESGIGDNDPKPPAPPVGDSEPPRLDQNLVTALYRVGLQPENITAGGVTATLADDVVVGVDTWLALNATALALADDRLFAARSNQDRLIRLVRSGLASAQEVVDCQAAMVEFDAATLARTTLLTAAFDSGTAALSVDAKDAITRVKSNGDAWNIPLEFLVLDHTQEEWVRLRAALANERISDRLGEERDGDDQSLLATERARSEVATAKSNLDTNLAAVKTAWEAAAAE